MGFSLRGECLQLVFRIAFIGLFGHKFLSCPRKYAVKQFHSTYFSVPGYRHVTGWRSATTSNPKATATIFSKGVMLISRGIPRRNSLSGRKGSTLTNHVYPLSISPSPVRYPVSAFGLPHMPAISINMPVRPDMAPSAAEVETNKCFNHGHLEA